MSECVYERIGDGESKIHKYRCGYCGHERDSNYPPNKIHRNCRKQATTGEKVTRFAAAAALHALRGSPKRTDDEIAKLYEICKTCDKFTSDNCRLCGCRVTRRKVYRNKLAWADQHCDEGKW